METRDGLSERSPSRSHDRSFLSPVSPFDWYRKRRSGQKVLKHVRIGHAQSPSIGKFRMDVAGLQLLTVNYWRNPGIISIFDWDGNLVEQGEPIHTGSPLLPVNWKGDGQEYVLLSGDTREGGMVDGQLRRVVMFPDDGHPDLAAYTADVTGDQRDEVIL